MKDWKEIHHLQITSLWKTIILKNGSRDFPGGQWNQDCWDKYQQLQICRWYHFTKIMASSPITSWQIDGERVETVTNFIPKHCSDYSHEIKRHLLLGREAMPDLDSELKSRDITLLTKVCIVRSMVFPVVIYGCESWTINKAEREE